MKVKRNSTMFLSSVPSTKGYVKVSTINIVEKSKYREKKSEVEWREEEAQPDDERMFFPTLTADYENSIPPILRLEHPSKWASLEKEAPIDLLGSDPGYREKPEYTTIPVPDVFLTPPPCVGQSFDVISMLSVTKNGLGRIGETHDGVEPEALRGKYVLLLCVFAPTRWVELNARHLSRLAILSDGLLRQGVDNFEVVIVPKMRKQWDDDADAFDQLLAPFSGRLAVPFSDRAGRDAICSLLGFDGRLRALLVGPDHQVLEDAVDDILTNHDIVGIESAAGGGGGGARFLPTPPLEKNPPSLSLAWLLSAKEDDLLHSLSSDQTISVAQLSKKLVGLYLIHRGEELGSFHKVYSQCKDKGLGFEIVLVPMPLFTSIHPLVFQKVVLREVRKHLPTTPSWWVLPYSNRACARIHKIGTEYSYARDVMTIVGPKTRFFVDEFGGDVARRFGIQAYPFNREVVVQQYLRRAKEVTLESLLIFGSIDYLVRNGETVPVSSLRGKNVFLYTDYFIRNNQIIYNSLVRWCQEHQNWYPGLDVELVFVYTDSPLSKTCKDPFPPSEIGLLVRPYDKDHTRFLMSHPAFFRGEDGNGYPTSGIKQSTVLAFGADGYLRSLQPMNFMTGFVNIKRVLGRKCCLREEILDEMHDEFDFMRLYYSKKPFDVLSLD